MSMGWACWMPKLQTHTDINQLQSVCQWAGPAGCQNYKHTRILINFNRYVNGLGLLDAKTTNTQILSTSIGMSMGWACWMPKLQTHTDINQRQSEYQSECQWAGPAGCQNYKHTRILINFNRYVNGLGLLDAKTTNTWILINFNRYVNGLVLLDAKTTNTHGY